MIKSIRNKMFFVMIILIIIPILISIILNSLYLEKFYIKKEKEILLSYANQIDNIYKDNIDIKLEEIYNEIVSSKVNLIILNKNTYNIKYYSYVTGKNMIMNKNKMIFSNQGIYNIVNNGYEYETQTKTMMKNRFLKLGYLLNNKDILILEVPLESIENSVGIANEFYIMAGFLILLLGSILAFVFSRNITKPIIDIKDIALKMADLDFSKKYKDKRDDEIGQLGNSINFLSYELENSINKLKEDIKLKEEIDKMRKVFISNVSHELKTPISIIQGYAQGLKDNITDESKKNYYCNVIIEESERMNFLVKDLLKLSKMQNNKLILNKGPFDISSLIDETLYKYKEIFKDKNINLRLFKGDIINVFADEIKLQQVIINYLDNAINNLDSKREINIKLIENKDIVKFSIYNSGLNIKKEDIDNIWTSFYKSDKSRNREYSGSGLGLSIVKEIMELHNGRYGCENKKEGVEFYFILYKNTQEI